MIYRISRLFVLYIGLFAIVSTAFAAIPRFQAGAKKRGEYIRNGVILGGEARRAFSFQDLRWAYGAKKGIERLIFEFGDEKGQEIKTRPGYFQVNVDPSNKVVQVEFSQIVGSRVDQKSLSKKLKSSPHIERVKMTYDPEDKGLSLQLFLKNRVGVEVFELPAKKKGGRLALDLKRTRI